MLGTGGAAKAVAYALQGMDIGCTLVSRSPGSHPGTVSYTQAASMAATHLLIVNATPVGMFPHTAQNPWTEKSALGPRHLCYDLIYNPSPTLFLRQAAEQGAATVNGTAMLHRQAELSWGLWQSIV